jgi:glycosyltransferase involved in cell wall biosynthesis
MTHLVSILIPAYNAERWIAHTVRSALAQTWPRTEIILVDDGSRDETLSIARQFASKNLSVVTQDNQGGSAARNRAFGLCQGDFIQWLDADDLLSPDKIARQVEAAVKAADKGILFSCRWGYFMYRPHRAWFSPTPLWTDLAPLEWLLRKWENNAHMNPATWLVSRELTEAAGPWDTRVIYSEDGEYFCRVILASNGIRFVPEATVFYRARTTSSASYMGRSIQKMESYLLSRQLEISHLRAFEDNDRVRAACLKSLQTGLINFYPEQPAFIRQSQQLAATLGGRLEIPKLSWKYLWLQKLFGFTAAKRAREHWNNCKASVLRFCDKALFRLEYGELPAPATTRNPSSPRYFQSTKSVKRK